MGHLINPIGFRLNRKEIKESYVPLYTKLNYKQSTNNLIEVNLYLKQFFAQSLFKKAGVIFSHFKLYETIKEVVLIVYVYLPDLIISNKRKFARYLKKYLTPYFNTRIKTPSKLFDYKSFYPKYGMLRREGMSQIFFENLKNAKFEDRRPQWVRQMYENYLLETGFDYRPMFERLRLNRTKLMANMLRKELVKMKKSSRLKFYKNFSDSFKKYIGMSPIKEILRKPLVKKKFVKNEKKKLSKKLSKKQSKKQDIPNKTKKTIK